MKRINSPKTNKQLIAKVLEQTLMQELTRLENLKANLAIEIEFVEDELNKIRLKKAEFVS